MSRYRSPMLYESRKIAAAGGLARGGNRPPAGSITPESRTRARTPRPLAGLGCDCDVRYRGGSLRRYREPVLNGVHKTELRGLAQSPATGTPALVPVSDRRAVDAAVRLFKGLKT